MEPTTTPASALQAIREQAMCPEEMKLVDEMLFHAVGLDFYNEDLASGKITQDYYKIRKEKIEADVMATFYEFMKTRLLTV